MEINPTPENFLSVEVRSGDTETRLEQMPAVENGTRRIRLSNLRSGRPQTGNVDLTEKELVTLLAQSDPRRCALAQFYPQPARGI